MKANKIIRHLVEQNVEQVDNANQMLRQNLEAQARMKSNHEHEISHWIARVDEKDRQIKALETELANLAEMRLVNGELRKRLQEAGLDAEVNVSDLQLDQLRKRLTGG